MVNGSLVFYNLIRRLECIMLNLVFSGVFLLLHFGQGELQVIDVLLELRAFVLQLPLLGGQFSVDLLLVLKSLACLFELCLQLDLTFDKTLTSLLSIVQSLVSLVVNEKDKSGNMSAFVLSEIYEICSCGCFLGERQIGPGLSAGSHVQKCHFKTVLPFAR